MKTTRRDRPLRLPENCAVRLIDLDVRVGGLIAVDEEGFVNIYLNARLSRDAQMKALRHELRHYYRDDLYSDADIREVERLADGPMIVDITGAPMASPTPVFDPEHLRAAGRGLYLPMDENRARASADLARIKALLMEACGIYDVLRGAPAETLRRLAGDLEARDIAFIAWQPPGASLPVALHFYREDAGRLYGAIYYDADGQLDDALAVFDADAHRVTVDIRKRGDALAVCAVTSETGAGFERIY